MDEQGHAARMRVGFYRALGIAVLAGALARCAPPGGVETQPLQEPPPIANQSPLVPPADWAYTDRFDSLVTLELKEATIEEAARKLTELGHVPVFVDPDLAKSDRRITLLPKFTVRLERGVGWVRQRSSAALVYTEDGVALVRPGSIPFTRSYDIANLLCSESAGFGFVPYIQAAVAPGTWRLADGGPEGALWPPYAARYANGRLTVTHTAAAQQDVEDALNDFRRARSDMVDVLTRFVEADKAAYAALRPRLRLQRLAGSGPKEKDPWSVSCAQLPGKDASQLLSELTGDRKGVVLFAAKLTHFSTQRFTLDAATLFPEGVPRRTVEGALDRAAQQRLLARLPISVQPFVSADRRNVTVVLGVQEPRPGGGLRERLLSTTVADGDSLLVEGLSHFDRDPRQQKEGMVLLLLLELRVVDDVFEEE